MSFNNEFDCGRVVDTFYGKGRELVCLNVSATTTEVNQSLNVDYVTDVFNDDGTNKLILSFDAISTADTNKQGLRSAYQLLTELYTKYLAHCALVGGTPCHKTADIVNNNVTALASESLADMLITAHSIKDKYNAHDADASTYHYAAGTAHQTAAADPTTLTTLITLVNEISGDLTAHMADDDCHGLVDTTNVITVANAAAGDMTLLKGDHVTDIPIQCSTVYFKSDTGTVAGRIWGVKEKNS